MCREKWDLRTGTTDNTACVFLCIPLSLADIWVKHWTRKLLQQNWQCKVQIWTAERPDDFIPAHLFYLYLTRKALPCKRCSVACIRLTWLFRTRVHICIVCGVFILISFYAKSSTEIIRKCCLRHNVLLWFWIFFLSIQKQNQMGDTRIQLGSAPENKKNGRAVVLWWGRGGFQGQWWRFCSSHSWFCLDVFCSGCIASWVCLCLSAPWWR